MRTNKNKKSSLLLASAAMAAALIMMPATSDAHGGGGGGAPGAGGSAMGSMHGGMSGMNGNFGGSSATHISPRGIANGNGPNATTRTFGTDRASLRNHATDVDDSTSTTTSGDIDANDGTKAKTSIGERNRLDTDEGAMTGTRLRHTNRATDVNDSTSLSGGNSAAHMSANGMANTNGPNAVHRLHGTARATARHTLHATRHPMKPDNDADDSPQ